MTTGEFSVGGWVGGLVLIKCLGGVVTRKLQKAWVFMGPAGAKSTFFLHRLMVSGPHTRSTFAMLSHFERVFGGQIHAQARAFLHTPAQLLTKILTF